MDAGGETWGQKKRSWQPVPLCILFSLSSLNMKWACSCPEEFLGFNNAGRIQLKNQQKVQETLRGEKKPLIKDYQPRAKINDWSCICFMNCLKIFM